MDMHGYQFSDFQLIQLAEPSGSVAGPSNKRDLRVMEKKRRKLDLVKCERCRLDRQKCNPVPRVWPTKCDRCVSRGFPCSEGKRIERKTKHALLLSKTPETGTSPEVLDNEEDFKNDLERWSILLSCSKLVGMGLAELSNLNKDITKPFLDQWVTENEYRYEDLLQEPNVEDLENTSRTLTDLLFIHQHRMIEDKSISHASSLSALSILTGQTLVNFSCGNSIHIWDRWYNNHLENIKRIGDIGSEFLCRQNLLQIYLQNIDSTIFDGKVLQMAEEMGTLESLRKCILEKVNAILYPYDLELKGLYNYPEISTYGMVWLKPDLSDCLHRTSTLQWMDAMIDKLDVKSIGTMFLHLEREVLNTPDILERTLLHVACQIGCFEGVKALLLKGANPYYTTVYGHTPLHYAAAVGSSEICKLLVDWDASSSSTNATLQDDGRDGQGNSPLYYAVGSKDISTVKLLLAHPLYGNPPIADKQTCPPPLIRAILDDEMDIARLMVGRGTNLMVKFQGKTIIEHLWMMMRLSKNFEKWRRLKEEVYVRMGL